MAQTIYLKESEKEALNKKMIELNYKLAKKGMRGISKESQIVHKIIELTVEKLDISEDGNLIIK